MESTLAECLQTQLVNSQHIEGLMKWLVESGASGLESVEIKPSPSCNGSLGCFTKIKRAAGDIIVKIPRDCILGLAEATKSELAQKLFEFEKQDSVSSSSSILTNEFIFWIYSSQCLLLSNKTEIQDNYLKVSSKWEAYLKSLPEKSPIASSWNEELFQTIAQTNLGSAVLAERNLLLEQQEFLQRILVALPGMLHPEICNHIEWSKGNYLSRRFVGRLANDGEGEGQVQYGGKVGCLVPFFDLLNHKNGQKVKFEIDELSLWYVTEYDLEVGEEIYNNYCSSSNEELLFTYGFAVPNNPLDSVPLKLVAAPKKPSKKSKKQSKDIVQAPKSLGIFHVRSAEFGGVPKGLFEQLIGSPEIDEMYPEEIDVVSRMIASKNQVTTSSLSQLTAITPETAQSNSLKIYLCSQLEILKDAASQLEKMKQDAIRRDSLHYH